MAKVFLLLLAAVLAVIAAAHLTFNHITSTDGTAVHQPWAQDRMEFLAWNNEKWTAWVRDGSFELRPQNLKKWSRHSNASLAFVDWEGLEWQAKIDGDMLLLAQGGDWNAPSQRAAAIRYLDWTGGKQLRTVAQLQR